MKKLLAILLAALMILGTALAEGEGTPAAEENADLTREELEMYLNVLAGDALALGADHTEVNAAAGETIITYLGDAKLTIADEELSENSAVLGAVLNVAQEDLRGIHMGAPLQEVLDVYPNNNPDLNGTYYDAALYVDDTESQTAVGYLLREGQQVTEVTHLVFTPQEDNLYNRCGITYAIRQNAVVGIEIFGLGALVDRADALEEIANVAQMQEMREFIPYPSNQLGENIDPFQESDLFFGSLDFMNLTNEAAVALLGESPVDDWLEDSTGEWLRTRQWDDVSIVFLYDSQKNFLRPDSLTIVGSGIEGPRGVRVDDTMESVMNRFRQGENNPLPEGIALYGDGETAPYGVLAYGDVTATLTYALQTASGQTVIWNLTFEDGLLQSHRMLLR